MVTVAESTIQSTAAFLKQKLPDHFQSVQLGIICGSGLGGLVDTIDPSTKIEFAYRDVPGFAVSTVAGHAGKLVFGYLGATNMPTVFMVGRFHFYEGHTLQHCTFPVRVMKLLGVESLIVTNACGSLNPEHKVGDIAVLNDHLSIPGMAGFSPLIGANVESFGPRFPAVSDAYTYALRRIAFEAAFSIGWPEEDIREGVYAFVAGPSYETRAEARYLASMGADVVGMSTVPEVIVARHSGIKVLGLSLITNAVVVARGRDAKKEVLRKLGKSTEDDNEIDTEKVIANHEEVLETSAQRAAQMQQLVKKIADLISSNQ